VEIVAGLLRHPSPISIDGTEACETFLYVFKVTDRIRKGHRLARTVVNTLRRKGELAKDELRRLNAELARLAGKTVDEVKAVAINTRRKLAGLEDPTPTNRATLERLELLAERLSQVAAQTRQRVVDGVTPAGATRLVSLHDPADAPMLPEAVARIKERTGRVPRAVTANRGYGEAAIDRALFDLGVTKVVIPTKGSTRRRPPRNREIATVPAIGALENRFRGTDQRVETSMGMPAHPDGQP
jgi:IS5 family transposase